MAGLTLHARAATKDRVRVWLCADGGQGEPPLVKWKLNGAAAQPAVLRPLAPSHAFRNTVMTGVFEFAGGGADTPFDVVDVEAAGSSARLEVRPFPSSIGREDWFRVLLCSCFHQAENHQALLARVFQNIPAAQRQDLSLFMGDQVYLDLPTLNNYPDDSAKLADRFERYYRTNWTTNLGLEPLFNAAPAVFCPDDHEYWNNFPHASPIIQNSWKKTSRERWKVAADQVYDAFQCTPPAARGDNIVVDVDPLSIMVLDQRSQRQDDRSATLGPSGLQQLNEWVDRLIAGRKIGAVVTGQSLLDKPVGKIQGAAADWVLSNYGDYESILKALRRLADAGRPVLLLTGDVHWGRITRIREEGRTRFIEIICSPSSLVTTIGNDQLRSIGAGFRRFFRGEKTRWPRHASVPDPEPYFAPQVFGKRFTTDVVCKHQGDQLAMLAFRQAAGGIEAKVTYYEVHERPNNPREIDLGLLR